MSDKLKFDSSGRSQDKHEFDTSLQKLVFQKSKQDSSKIEGLSLLPEQMDNITGLNSDYNGKYHKKADKFTPDAKAKYIIADKHYYSLTSSNMNIYSGTRDVEEQAKLYIRNKYHGQGNRASWPGCSLHNWGLAADMIRTDEANVVKAMNKGGWTKTVSDEGWHFECTSSSDHTKAQAKIASFRKKTGLAYKWSESVAKFYRDTKDFNARITPFNNRVEGHRQNEQILQGEIEQYNRAAAQLKNRVANFNRDANNYNTELQRAKDLVRQINSLPSGPSRNGKIREFRRLEAWLDQESTRLDAEISQLRTEENRLSAESGRLDGRIAAYRAEEKWLSSENIALAKLKKDTEQYQKDANAHLTKISQAVGI